MAQAEKTISEKIVAALPIPATGNKVYWFSGAAHGGKRTPSGFSVRITAAGARSFTLFRRDGARKHLHTLGRVGTMTVREAIAAAEKIVKDIGSGRREDARPARTRRMEARDDHFAAGENTVAAVLDEFVKRHVVANKLRSGTVVAGHLEQVKLAIGHIDIHQLRKSDIVKMLDDIADKRGDVAADRNLAYVRAALRWYEGRNDSFVAPISRTMMRTKPKERAKTRTLTDQELRDLRRALDTVGEPHRSWVWLLLLCAARLKEIAWAHAREFDGANLVIPAERYKSKVTHMLPLSDTALALIPRGNGYLFGGAKPVNGFGHIKRRIDKAIADIRRQDGREAMPAWTYHDLRRTARSLMSRVGVTSDIAERVLGHRIAGIRSVYDMHDYLKEKAVALRELASLVNQVTK
jgi:hypothetical protein